MKLNYRKICILPLFIYFFYTLLNTLVTSFTGLAFIFPFVDFCLALLVITLVLGMFSVINQFDTKIGLFIFLIVLFQLLNYLLYTIPPPRYFEYMRLFFLLCMPLSIMIYFADKRKFLESMYIAGLVYGIFFLIILFLYFTDSIGISVYNTSLGYSVLLPEIVLLSELKEKRGIVKIISVISILAFITVVVLFGSRGPLVSLFAFIFYDYAKSVLGEQRLNKKTVGIMLGTTFITVCFVFFEDIMKAVNAFLNEIGIYSRTLRLFASNIGHLSGREEKYSIVLDAISDQPFAIRGIAGDTVLTGGSYSHNLFLELFCEFGIILGTLAVLFIIYRVFRCLFIMKYGENKLTVFALFASVIPLMFSGTLWINSIFWMWLVSYNVPKQSTLKSLDNSVEQVL